MTNNSILTNQPEYDCTEIYEKAINETLKNLKRFREIWNKHSHNSTLELIQYAHSDFYFYRFAIEIQEKNTNYFLVTIINGLIRKYGIESELPKDIKNTPFALYIAEDGKRVGYRFSDLFEEEYKQYNEILRDNDLFKIVLLRTWDKEKSKLQILRENNSYRQDGLNLEAMTIEDFFVKHFSEKEFIVFRQYLQKYIDASRKIIGFKPLQFLSLMNLSSLKILDEKVLSDWDYEKYRYQIIDEENTQKEKYRNTSQLRFSHDLFSKIKKEAINNSFEKIMIGSANYAESFLTSEWLYHSIHDEKHFDYTAIISGYLKSVEQLLYKIVMSNIDNNCKISLNNKLYKEAKANGISMFKNENGNWLRLSNPKEKYKYIDLTHSQQKYMDNSTGTFEFFLRYNPHVFIDRSLANPISNIISCFREECRNSYFHINNLNDWDVVKKTRNNAIYIYFLLLGACKIGKDKLKSFGATEMNHFSEVCSRIRESANYKPEFIFKYTNGAERKMIFDRYNNTLEFNENGIEHYDNLIFYDVDDFSYETYQKLDAGELQNRQYILTENNLPSKIFGLRRDKTMVEIPL